MRGQRGARPGFVWAALRSGLRRYPRDIARSLARTEQVPPPAHSALELPARASLAAAWLGHATVLLRIGGLTILTDPVLSDRIGVRLGGRVIGPGRLIPGVDPLGLPPIDVVLISHAHFDHLDRPTLAALASERTVVVTARRTRRLIPPGYARVIEADWGQEVAVGGDAGDVRIRAVEPAHWGARTALDRRRGYNAYLLSAPDARALFAGDTARTDRFDACGPVDLAVFGIGAYDPWEHAHATPEQVWEMFRRLGGRWLLPVHHSTFRLSDEHPDEPMRRLLRAAGRDRPRVIVPSVGRVWTPPGYPAMKSSTAPVADRSDSTRSAPLRCSRP